VLQVRHKATGLFLSCVTSRPGSGEGEGASGSGSSGDGAPRLVFRRDGLSPASWFRLGPPPKGNSACHVLSASTRYVRAAFAFFPSRSRSRSPLLLAGA
jgi:hypothetical protein